MDLDKFEQLEKRIAHIATGYIISTCCSKTGGQIYADCDCRSLAKDILIDIWEEIKEDD